MSWQPRVVLDSMYFRGANAQTIARLEEIQEKSGCRYSVSFVAVLEALRRMSRDEVSGALRTPLKKISHLLTTGDELAPTDYYRPPSARRLIALGKRPREYIREMRMIWTYLNDDERFQRGWRTSADFAERRLSQSEQRWKKFCRRLDPIASRVVKALGVKGALPILLAIVRGGSHRDPRLWSRFDAFDRVWALRLVLTATGADNVVRNDDADARLLLHLSDGCILLTDDDRLRRHVRESKSHQAPWIRTLDELEAEIPIGLPWRFEGFGSLRPKRATRRAIKRFKDQQGLLFGLTPREIRSMAIDLDLQA